jgi:hypothetical protein
LEPEPFLETVFQMIRILLGIFAVCLVIFLVILVPHTVAGLLSKSIIFSEMGLGLAIVASIYGVALLIFWGIPIHLLFLFLKIRSIWAYLISGFVGGSLFVLIFRPFGEDPIFKLTVQSLIFGGFGLLAGFVFWLVVIKSRSGIFNEV